eukprot:TRINITY_DN5840_c0_g1_i2.p1 TRINITY_DN5840_c0_g1~~TRINITY_DN5840_c0_g1_i2.p1  ORF type:complete len:266 (+),score=44.13 TRINITY_DN5840_c0_g1_i2:316-1113(+)
MIERFPKLKVIANHGAGYNHIDAKYAAMKGILVTNTPGVVGPATADVAMAHLLNITRRFSESERWLRREKTTQGGWTMFMSHSPEGKRMGIFGLGSIGKQVAKRARAFDMVVQYHNRNRVPEGIERELGVTYVDKETLLRTSHYIVLCVPLTRQTFHFLDEKEFELMKDGVYLINVSRGEIMNETILVKYLKSGKVAGAGLDVFEREPIVHPELYLLPNVSMTPHIGTASYETRRDMEELTLNNIDMVLTDRPPLTPVHECNFSI